MSGSILEVTVVGASGVKDRELFTRQDPYVLLEYANQRFKSKTDIDGGTTPAFNSSFQLSLLPGLDECSAVLWNENVLKDTFIGSCRIKFSRVYTTGFEDSYVPLYDKRQHQRGYLHVLLKLKAPHTASTPYSAPAFTPAYPPAYSAPYPSIPSAQPPPAPAYPYSYSAPPVGLPYSQSLNATAPAPAPYPSPYPAPYPAAYPSSQTYGGYQPPVGSAPNPYPPY